jgi:hypothetical protein
MARAAVRRNPQVSHPFFPPFWPSSASALNVSHASPLGRCIPHPLCPFASVDTRAHGIDAGTQLFTLRRNSTPCFFFLLAYSHFPAGPPPFLIFLQAKGQRNAEKLAYQCFDN